MLSALELATRICGAIISAMLLLLLHMGSTSIILINIEEYVKMSPNLTFMPT